MSDIVLFFPKTGYDIKNSSVELPLSMLSLASVLVDDYEINELTKIGRRNLSMNYPQSHWRLQ